MKKTEIIKKYTEIYGKRPTLQLDKSMSDDEKFKIKQTTKLNQFKWTLKKQIFVESIEKADPSIEDKVEFAKYMTLYPFFFQLMSKCVNSTLFVIIVTRVPFR